MQLVPDVLRPVLLDGRLPAMVAGIVFLAFGARVYGLVVVAPGIIGGLAMGAAVGQAIGGSLAVSVAMTVCALAGAVLCQLFEKVAVAVAGAGLGTWAAWAGWPLAAHVQAPWWGLLGAGLVGVVVFPRVYGVLLKPATAVLGAWTVAWSVHREHSPALVGGLAICGTVLQFWLGGRSGAAAKTRPAKSKAERK